MDSYCICIYESKQIKYCRKILDEGQKKTAIAQCADVHLPKGQYTDPSDNGSKNMNDIIQNLLKKYYSMEEQGVEFAPNVYNKQNSKKKDSNNGENMNEEKTESKTENKNNDNNDNNDKNDNNNDNNSVDAKRVRIVHISDTHCRHIRYSNIIPFGDILIISGDFTTHCSEIRMYDSTDNYNGQSNNNNNNNKFEEISLENEEGFRLKKLKIEQMKEKKQNNENGKQKKKNNSNGSKNKNKNTDNKNKNKNKNSNNRMTNMKYKSYDMCKEIYDFNEWIGKLPHKYKIIIGGNHEILFNWFTIYEIQKVFTNAIYLQDSEINIYGINFYGIPWTNSRNMAFSLSNDKESKYVFKNIPNNTNILITHSPPLNIFDLASRGSKNIQNKICNICNEKHDGYGHWGSKELLDIVCCSNDNSKNKNSQNNIVAHLFGHVHDSIGWTVQNNVLFINSAMDMYQTPHRFNVVFDL